MNHRIITISEDAVTGRGLFGQLGLSIFIELGNKSILFDTGQGSSAAWNADFLRINLNKLDKIVLSHGHFDHTGGLRDILIRTGKMDIVAHPDIWKSHYVRNRFIGIPFQREELERLGARFMFSKEPIEIVENVITTGEIPMVTEFEGLPSNLFVIQNGKLVPDEVRDDQGLIITTGRGLIILLGCAHRGVINTIHHAMELTGIDNIHAVIGGCHLKDQDMGPRIESTIQALKDIGVSRLGVSHCTGIQAAIRMKEAFGDKFFFNNTGSSITFD